MTADTPTPYTPPDGVILTTMGEARRIGHGQVAMVLYDDWSDSPRWGGLDPTWRSDRLVWWRPTPERTVTIDYPNRWCDGSLTRAGGVSRSGAYPQSSPCRCAQLDGDK